MYIPEYTITPSILKNAASFEYNRALIKNTTLMPNFELKLEKESQADFYNAELNLLGVASRYEDVKRYTDGLPSSLGNEIEGLNNAFRYIKESSKTLRLEEEDIVNAHIFISEHMLPHASSPENYRGHSVEYKTYPEEIKNNISEMLDWYNSLDAMDTHPILAAGIIKAQIETIQPFSKLNFMVADLITKAALLSRGYYETNYMSIEFYYYSSKKEYQQALNSIVREDYDLTSWLEYFTEGMASQIAKAEEKVKMFGKDTKLARVSGRIHLTPRQEKIVEYLNDYGMLQNKQFPLLFPGVSEDSVLRDLKKLVEEEIIAKRGSTKSSRYELK